MKRVYGIILLFTAVTHLQAQEKLNQAIKNFGGIYPIPEAVEYPDPKIKYKIIVDLYESVADPKEQAYSLYNLSRMLNLHMAGGVPKENLEVVAVIHGPSTKAVLSNEAYKKKFKKDNPNLDLIRELNDFGVKLLVCGQSLKGRDIEVEDKTEEVGLSISALTVLTTYQLKGYTLLSFK